MYAMAEGTSWLVDKRESMRIWATTPRYSLENAHWSAHACMACTCHVTSGVGTVQPAPSLGESHRCITGACD